VENIDGVLQSILDNLRSTPFLGPSPQGGRRRIK
jgi:hypothetical protein